MANISDSLASNAVAPKRAQGDSGSMEQHSLPDQIEADRYLLAKAARKRGLGVRFMKISPNSAADITARTGIDGDCYR